LQFLGSSELRDDIAKGQSPEQGRAMPGDIHGYSGQLTGGRSASWESHHSSGSTESAD
jgi:hypothetical protein